MTGHSVKYWLEKCIAIPYHQQETHRCQENFEVFMSCVVKYTSKSIYVKSLSKTKNKISPSKQLFSQSSSQEKFAELEIDEEMSYSQWQSVDRTTLRTHTADVDDFIELLVYSVNNLTTHSFIAKSHAQHLKQRKEEITETECIILLEFTENYHYVVQDEIQGYH